jgi:hypothetical protein
MANLMPTVCPYGCQYFNEGWHAENCPGPPPKPEDPKPPDYQYEAFKPAFTQEPEYQREQDADEVERRREEAEDVRTIYPEKGMTDD